MRPTLRRQLLHLAADLSALVQNPDDLGHGFDLLTRSYSTPVADAARASLRSCVAIAPLLRERYWGHWPSQTALLAMPSGSLGHGYASWFADAGGQPLPDPQLAEGTDGEDIWVHQRVRHTHDLWHVVCGCPPAAAGEAALSAINVMQLRWPGNAMLLGADLLHRCLEGPIPGEVDVGQAGPMALSWAAPASRCSPSAGRRDGNGHWPRGESSWGSPASWRALPSARPAPTPCDAVVRRIAGGLRWRAAAAASPEAAAPDQSAPPQRPRPEAGRRAVRPPPP